MPTVDGLSEVGSQKTVRKMDVLVVTKPDDSICLDTCLKSIAQTIHYETLGDSSRKFPQEN